MVAYAGMVQDIFAVSGVSDRKRILGKGCESLYFTSLGVLSSLFDIQRRAKEFIALFFKNSADNFTVPEGRQFSELGRAYVDGPPVQTLQEGN